MKRLTNVLTYIATIILFSGISALCAYGLMWYVAERWFI